MNKIKEYWEILFIILITNLFCIFVFTVTAFADETDGSQIRSLNMSILCSDNALNINDENIYYLNSTISVSFPENINDIEEDVSLIIEEIKNENPGKEPEVIKDIYYGKATWNGSSFSAYEEMSDLSIVLSPNEGDTTNLAALKFECVKSYKILIDGSIKKMVNITYLSSPYQFTFDKTVPEIVRTDTNDYSTATSQGSVASFKVSDSTGIKCIELIRNEKVIDSVSMNIDTRMVEYEYDVSLFKENSKTDELKLIATDLAGNKNEYMMNYEIDSDPPEISLSGISAGETLKDGLIMSGDCKVMVVSKENCSKQNVFFKCLYSDGTGTTKCLEDLTGGYESEAILERTYTEEGVYDIVTFSYDESGNYSETIRISFGIDKGAPKVAIDNVINDNIYNAPVSIYATVKELFFEGVNANVEAVLKDKSGERKLDVSPFVIGAKTNRNVYTFSKDGSYTVTLTAKDAVNREANTSCRFVIDRTAPLIEIKAGSGSESDFTNVDEGKTTVCSKRPTFNIATYDDTSEYDICAVLYKKGGDGNYREEKRENVVSVGREAVFPIEVTSEGEFTLKVTLVDKALNTSEKTVSFIVDEEPPVIAYIDAFNEKYLKYFTLPENMKDYIQDATKVKYKAYLNSKEVSSVELKKDGKYILQIVAEDEAGNTSEKVSAFIVDNTMPKVIVHGIENGGNVKKDEVVKLTLFDDNDFFKSVCVNGEEMSIDDKKEVSIKANDYGDYDISVVAADYAGNEIKEVVKMQCALSDNPFKVTIDDTDIKTLTKNDTKIRESFFDRYGSLKILAICSVFALPVLIFALYRFVDTKKNKG